MLEPGSSVNHEGIEVTLQTPTDETSPEKKESSCRIYVGNLDYSIREIDLRTCFETFGELRHVEVLMDKDDGSRSRGYGFVEFTDPANAEAATAMNNQDFFGRKMIVNLSDPKSLHPSTTDSTDHASCRLYVGNLDFSVTEQDLRRFFETFGPLTSAMVMMDKSIPPKSRGFGFVQYQVPHHAVAAATGADGKPLKGREMRVNIAEPKAVIEFHGGYNNDAYSNQEVIRPTHKQQNAVSSTRLFVGNFNYEMTQNELYTLFRRFGPLIETQVMMELDHSKSRGFGFVEFASSAHAMSAYETMNGFNHKGRILKVQFAAPQDQLVVNRNEQVGTRTKYDSNRNDKRLYVGNLDFSVRAHDLIPLFEKYGLLDSCEIMFDRDRPELSRGYAWIHYKDAKSADDALEMNGYMFLGRPMRVNANGGQKQKPPMHAPKMPYSRSSRPLPSHQNIHHQPSSHLSHRYSQSSKNSRPHRSRSRSPNKNEFRLPTDPDELMSYLMTVEVLKMYENRMSNPGPMSSMKRSLPAHLSRGDSRRSRFLVRERSPRSRRDRRSRRRRRSRSRDRNRSRGRY